MVDAPAFVFDAGVDAPRPDARGLVIRSDGGVLRDAAPLVDDAGPIVDAVPGIDAMPSPCTVQLLGNRGFDDSVGSGLNKDIAPWVQNPGDVVVTAEELAANGQPPPQTGTCAAWLGGANFRTDFIYQPVSVPPATESLRLDGYLFVRTNESPPGQFDRLFVNIYNATGSSLLDTVHIYYERDRTTAWQSFSLEVPGSYAGLTILLAFESENDFSRTTSFFLDTLALTADVCP